MQRLLWILIAAVLCLASAGPASALVWDGNGHDYKVMKLADSSWNGATEDLSNKLGAGYTLATITSAGEQGFINELLQYYCGEFWIGGLQDIDQGDPNSGWKWTTGEEWHYTNWAIDEANDYHGNNEKFLAVWSKYDPNSWKWNDEGNFGNISGYIAESSPVPEPGTIVLMGLGLVGLAGVGRKRFRN